MPPRQRLRAGVILGPLAACGMAFLLLPLIGLVIRAPWSRVADLLTEHSALIALRLSLECATAATLISLTLGIPVAWLFARVEFPGKRVLRSLVTLPLVLPPVVAGVALLSALGRRGILGPILNPLGISLPFTSTGVIIAETFVAMPFLIVTVEGALASIDSRFEEAAQTLGASSWRVFVRVTLPLIKSSVAAGAVLCFARALGEFGATITFAGNLPGTTQTMPLAVYIALETDPSAAIALALVLLAISVAVLLLLRERWLRPALRS